ATRRLETRVYTLGELELRSARNGRSDGGWCGSCIVPLRDTRREARRRDGLELGL
ncbi:MAG: hypothetical protein GY723_12200, partial [bacterium]|nr:hypothetical protein [bacterium]